GFSLRKRDISTHAGPVVSGGTAPAARECRNFSERDAEPARNLRTEQPLARASSQRSASRLSVARKLRLRVPASVVPNTSALSPANVPENPLATSRPPNSGRRNGSGNVVCWLVKSSPFQVPSPTL